MNIQTEQLQNHTARMVVEFEIERLASAKQKAAKKISQQLNIPGFRKGKAPYNVVVRWVGENAILDEAMELISNDIYKEALEQSGLDPYGPGAVEKYDTDPGPRIEFNVPLQPVVNLNAYRDVRQLYAAPIVEEKDVDEAFKRLQNENAVVEDSTEPAVMGNRVTLDVHSFIEPQEGSEDQERVEFMHEHAAEFTLSEEDDVLPGFVNALVGITAGESREFELKLADDDASYPGRRVTFEVHCEKVQAVTLPELTDEFAAQLTKDEEQPLNLEALRTRVRENMEQREKNRVESQFADASLDAIVNQATVQYPEALVNDQIETQLRQLDERLKENKLTLRDYMQIYRKSPEDMLREMRPSAERTVRRALVMREVGIAEQLSVSDDELESQMLRMLGMADSEESKAQAKSLLEHPSMRDSVRETLMRERILERIVAIAKGEAPALTPPAETSEAPAAPAEATDTSSEPSTQA